jgi:hypothetical protein
MAGDWKAASEVENDLMEALQAGDRSVLVRLVADLWQRVADLEDEVRRLGREMNSSK